MSVTPFHPITKEQAADVLGASIRTIENYVSTGIMPAPVSIGRRVYWHPDVFYGWLDAHLKNSSLLSSEVGIVATQVDSTIQVPKLPELLPRRQVSSEKSGPAGTRALNKAAAKSKALIAELGGS